MADCIIWGTPATHYSDNGDVARVDSLRADGKYRVTGTVINKVQNLPIEQKKRLTTWLVRQRRAGISIPEVSSYTLDEIQSRPLLSFADRVNAALEYFSMHAAKIGSQLLVANGAGSPWGQMAAHTECEDISELHALLQLMVAQHLLNVDASHTQFRLAPAGWERIDALFQQRTDSARAFVAMWFHESTEEPYRNGIHRALLDAGYDPVRVDAGHHHLNKVDDEIIAEIRRSRFLVADFTCEPKQVRGGVYFEAGFAMGLNIPIIWTCNEKCLSDLHFDTRQYPHIAWKDSNDLYARLKARIGAVVGDGPKRPAGKGA